MRFASTVALSTLALAATAAAVPSHSHSHHDSSSSESTGRGSCHHHGKSHHKKMSASKCQNLKDASVVGYKSDGNCYDKDMLSHLATLHPNSSGTCYYVPSKSSSDAEDLDDRALEERSLKHWLVAGAATAAVHQQHKKDREHHEQQQYDGQPSSSENEPREFIDIDDYLYGREFDDVDELYEREFDDLDGLYERDLNVLEERGAGKVILGAIAGGWAAHEWDKHEKKEKKEKEEKEKEAEEEQ
ncbi:hypothetical protein CVT26_016168 [Gymnopilus dilepis]|uniref:Uncharacterized protein n=1 Tax=Gymnopilus dilepis TaxID=231916 RepID=A0A409XZ25_9AGAR|nr:hypothetical protein CVT26_016168 [Gymnopilus dilepis]